MSDIHDHPDGNGRIVHTSETTRISTESGTGTGRLIAIVAGTLLILLGIGFSLAFAARHRHEDIARRDSQTVADARESVEVVAVRSTASSYPITLPGQTAGWYQSTIYARVDGYVGSWTSDIGDAVKQGQVLATIDTPELDQQLNAARAKAAASDAQVEVAQSNVSIAQLTYDRWRESPKGVVSEQEREEKKAGFDAAKAHVAEAKAQAQLDEADVGRYSALETFKKVTAPYDGVITARHVDIGDLVSMGSSANTSSLYSIAQSKVIRVFVDVPQKAAADMTSGLKAHATSDQFPGRKFQGKIARTAMSIDPQTRTEKVEVDIPNADLTLLPGMYLQVTFELNQHGLMQVPAAAMLNRPDGMEVAVVNDSGKVDFRPVSIAKDDGDTVELGSGVKPGDRVALNISSDITPGEQVDAIEEQAEKPTVQNADVARELPAAHPPGPNSGVKPPMPAKAPG